MLSISRLADNHSVSFIMLARILYNYMHIVDLTLRSPSLVAYR